MQPIPTEFQRINSQKLAKFLPPFSTWSSTMTSSETFKEKRRMKQRRRRGRIKRGGRRRRRKIYWDVSKMASFNWKLLVFVPPGVGEGGEVWVTIGNFGIFGWPPPSSRTPKNRPISQWKLARGNENQLVAKFGEELKLDVFGGLEAMNGWDLVIEKMRKLEIYANERERWWEFKYWKKEDADWRLTSASF